MRGSGGQAQPHALIVRLSVHEDPENERRKTSYLAVAKITPTGACITDRIKGGRGDNARARAAADAAAGKPCLMARP